MLPRASASNRRTRLASDSPTSHAAARHCRSGSRPIPSGLGQRIIGVQVDLLILQRPPEPLHEDVVEVAALAVHADLDPPVAQNAGEVPRRREPWSVLKMVGRPKCARASLNASMQKPVSSVLDSRHARTRREYQYDRHQVGEAARHRDVGDIAQTWFCDREPPQQIRVDGVVRRRRARCGLWRRALQPHQPHQALEPTTTHGRRHATGHSGILTRQPPGDRLPEPLLLRTPRCRRPTRRTHRRPTRPV